MIEGADSGTGDARLALLELDRAPLRELDDHGTSEGVREGAGSGNGSAVVVEQHHHHVLDDQRRVVHFLLLRE